MSHGMRIGRIVFATFSLVAALALASAAPAASDSKAEPAPTAPVPAEAAPQPVADKRAENAEQLRIAQRRLDSGDPTDGTAAQNVALLQSLDAVLAQQLAVQQQIKDLETRKHELESQIQSAPADDAKAKFSFEDLDDLKDELATEQARSTLVDDKLTGAKASLEKAQTVLEEGETKRRQAQEALETGKNTEKSADLAIAAEGAVQNAKLADGNRGASQSGSDTRKAVEGSATVGGETLRGPHQATQSARQIHRRRLRGRNRRDQEERRDDQQIAAKRPIETAKRHRRAATGSEEA